MTDIISYKKNHNSTKALLSDGFTIVEVLIFLAISGLLLVSALSSFSGQQQRTTFSQATRDLESQMQDIINDLNSGYYPSTGNVRCIGTATGPQLDENPVGQPQGTNEACIFMGRVINFTEDSYRVFTVAGLREATPGSPSRNLSEAQPRAIAKTTTNSAPPELTEVHDLSYGIKVAWVREKDETGSLVSPAIGLFSALSKYQTDPSSGNIVSGTQQVDLIPVANVNLTNSSKEVAEFINAMDPLLAEASKNPPDGIAVCLDSGSNQYAVLTLGGQSRILRTDLVINEGVCP